MSSPNLNSPSENSPRTRAEEIPQWLPEWFTQNNAPKRPTPAAESPATVYAVVVHDDEVHSFRDYVEILEQVFGYSEPAAYELTKEIASSGRCIVWKGLRDLAERKAQTAREHQPEWRRGESITAPHRVEEYVPPLTITVELAQHAQDSWLPS